MKKVLIIFLTVTFVSMAIALLNNTTLNTSARVDNLDVFSNELIYNIDSPELTYKLYNDSYKASLNDITIKVSSSASAIKINLAVANNLNFKYQFWSKNLYLTPIGEEVESWFLCQNYSENKEVIINKNDVLNKNKYIIKIRISDLDKNIIDIDAKFLDDKINPSMSNLVINDKKEQDGVNYCHLSENLAVINFDVNLVDEVKIYIDDILLDSKLNLNNAKTKINVTYSLQNVGNHKLKIVLKSAKMIITNDYIISVFDEQDHKTYSVINGLVINDKKVNGITKGDSNVKFEILSSAGDKGSKAPIGTKYLIHFDGKQQSQTDNNIFQLNLDKYGIYYYIIYSINDCVVQDFYEGYYHYDRPGTSELNVSLNKVKFVPGETLEVKFSAIIGNIKENIQYSLIMYNSSGWHTIQDYRISTTNNFQINNLIKGKYLLKVRAKLVDGGSYEIEKDVIYEVGENIINDENTIQILDTNHNEAKNIYARIPYIIKVNNTKLNNHKYKFIITSEGQWIEKQLFTAENEMLFLPNKSGDFNIFIRIIEGDSFGFTAKELRLTFNVKLKNFKYETLIELEDKENLPKEFYDETFQNNIETFIKDNKDKHKYKSEYLKAFDAYKQNLKEIINKNIDLNGKTSYKSDKLTSNGGLAFKINLSQITQDLKISLKNNIIEIGEFILIDSKKQNTESLKGVINVTIAINSKESILRISQNRDILVKCNLNTTDNFHIENIKVDTFSNSNFTIFGNYKAIENIIKEYNYFDSYAEKVDSLKIAENSTTEIKITIFEFKPKTKYRLVFDNASKSYLIFYPFNNTLNILGTGGSMSPATSSYSSNVQFIKKGESLTINYKRISSNGDIVSFEGSSKIEAPGDLSLDLNIGFMNCQIEYIN